MKLKKKYRFDNKRQIWRIIPSNDGKLIIEEREPGKKQVFFSCIGLDSGKKIFKDFQPENNFWMGIETVRDDIIFFHKFAKPDMPKHRGIFAFDIRSKNFIWENAEVIFNFILDDKLYAFREKFEGRDYYSLNPFNGEIIENLGENYDLINNLRNKSAVDEDNKGYLFPEYFEDDSGIDSKAGELIMSLREHFVISGKVEYILKNGLLLMSFHEVTSGGSFNNLFKAVDLSTGKYILEETLNKGIRLFMSDSFFIKNNLLFVLFGKSKLVVYEIIN